VAQPPNGTDLPEPSSTKPPATSAGEDERRRITGRAGIVALGTLASRLLGLVRDQVLAAVFTRAATDAFFVAFTIPNVLRQLLAEGAIQSAVLPVLSRTREQEGEAAAKRFFAAARGLSLTILLGVSVAGVVFAPELVELFASGFKDIPGQFERTVSLTRWVFPYIFFMGTAALGVAALNTHQRFVVTSFAPALLNVAFIACALGLTGWLISRGEEPILAMAIGALVGGLLQVVAQWPSLRAIGYLTAPRFEAAHPGIREVLRRMGPVLFGIGVYAIDVLVARRLLSELPVGSQSYFTFAQRLCDFPQGIFVMALQTATLPSLSLLVARGDRVEVERTFAFGMRLSLFVGLPATLLLVFLAEPIVVAIFQRGEFGALAAEQTARALMAQGAGIWTVAAVRQLVAVYYALGDTKTPVLVATIDFLIFFGSAVWLREALGHIGVSLAVAIASTAQMLLLWTLLRRRLDRVCVGEIALSAGRTLLAAVPAGVAAALWAHVSTPLFGTGPLLRIFPGVTAAGVFAAVFLSLAALVKSEELTTLIAAVRRRRG